MHLPFGAQLWALKNILIDEISVSKTFERLAESGFTCIEPAGFNLEEKSFQHISVSTLKHVAHHFGLQIPAAHVDINLENAKEICECLATINLQYVVLPKLKIYTNQTIDDYKRIATELNRINGIAKSYQLKLAFHNHSDELKEINGFIPFDILLEYTDDDVAFEMDLGWMHAAGKSPIDYFKRFPQRFQLWHIRQQAIHPESITAIYSGNNVDFTAIFATSAIAGLQYPIIELKSGIDEPLEKMIAGINNIRNKIV